MAKDNTTKEQLREYHREYYKKNKPAFIERRKRWAKNNIEKLSQIKRAWSVKNKQKVTQMARNKYYKTPYKAKAHGDVSRAIASGKLKRDECCAVSNENCRGRVELHHDDYTKPLQVTPFCKVHHSAWHRLFIAES